MFFQEWPQIGGRSVKQQRHYCIVLYFSLLSFGRLCIRLSGRVVVLSDDDIDNDVGACS